MIQKEKIEEYHYLIHHEDYEELNINQKIQAKHSHLTKNAPVKVQAPDVCEIYLTPGKRYKVINARDWDENNGWWITLIDDDGIKISGYERKSVHLRGSNWIVVKTVEI